MILRYDRPPRTVCGRLGQPPCPPAGRDVIHAAAGRVMMGAGGSSGWAIPRSPIVFRCALSCTGTQSRTLYPRATFGTSSRAHSYSTRARLSRPFPAPSAVAGTGSASVPFGRSRQLLPGFSAVTAPSDYGRSLPRYHLCDGGWFRTRFRNRRALGRQRRCRGSRSVLSGPLRCGAGRGRESRATGARQSV